MAGFRQDVIAQVVGTVIGGMILAALMGSGSGSKLARFVILVGALALVAFFVIRR